MKTDVHPWLIDSESHGWRGNETSGAQGAPLIAEFSYPEHILIVSDQRPTGTA